MNKLKDNLERMQERYDKQIEILENIWDLMIKKDAERTGITQVKNLFGSVETYKELFMASAEEILENEQRKLG